jgi:hypothetical protein
MMALMGRRPDRDALERKDPDAREREDSALNLRAGEFGGAPFEKATTQEGKVPRKPKVD